MKLIDITKIKKENRQLKKQVQDLTKELENIYKGITIKGDLYVIPKDTFNDIWNKANDTTEVYVYQDIGYIDSLVNNALKKKGRVIIEYQEK